MVDNVTAPTRRPDESMIGLVKLGELYVDSTQSCRRQSQQHADGCEDARAAGANRPRAPKASGFDYPARLQRVMVDDRSNVVVYSHYKVIFRTRQMSTTLKLYAFKVSKPQVKASSFSRLCAIRRRVARRVLRTHIADSNGAISYCPSPP